MSLFTKILALLTPPPPLPPLLGRAWRRAQARRAKHALKKASAARSPWGRGVAAIAVARCKAEPKPLPCKMVQSPTRKKG